MNEGKRQTYSVGLEKLLDLELNPARTVATSHLVRTMLGS
jgi:hypothetical protein